MVYLRLFLSAAFCFSPAVLLAASFDCNKAASKIEKTICQDSQLSALDSDLGHLFNSLREGGTSVVDDQKNWLKNTRGKCGDIDCLKAVYSDRILLLKNSKDCPVGEKDILGSWVRVKNGFFEEMSFSKNGVRKDFSSLLHQRPELNSTWRLGHCVISIDGKPGGLSFSLKILSVSKEKMRVFDDEEQKTAVYKRPG